MDKTIESFEKKREDLYRELQEIGDFRRESFRSYIVNVGRRTVRVQKKGILGMDRCIYGTRRSKGRVMPRV